jgi:S-methylmethionine-dependent homocysteine/selenocysteine methylase
MNAEQNDLTARLGEITSLEESTTLLLDGATGTELERRDVQTTLPLWSAWALSERPDVVEQIHADYVDAGVDAITANTFRTQRRTLALGGWENRVDELTQRAVTLARSAASRAEPGRRVFVLGSAPTLEDCYRPDLVPRDEALVREHRAHAEALATAGVDGLIVETMNTIREAVTATRAARATGLPVLVSFVCWEGAKLLSGEPLGDALVAVEREGPVALLVNCLPATHVPACLEVLASHEHPFGAYANLGTPEPVTGFSRREDCTPEQFAAQLSVWTDAGARIVGGCCGTTPHHLRAAVRKLRGGDSRGAEN